MAKGDHLVVERGLYSHHGIDLGNGWVIHYTKDAGAKSVVKNDPKKKFADGGRIRLGSSKAKYSRDEIVRRAMRRFGEKEYGLISNNCEHFVNWCRTGKHESQQVNRAAALACSPIVVAVPKPFPMWPFPMWS